MTPVIAPAGPETDWRAIHALLQRAFGYMAGRIDPPSSLHRLSPEDLAQKSADQTVLITQAPDPIACLFLEDRGEALYLGKLAVDPAHQGTGAGRALVDAAERLAIARGIPRLALQTRVELSENHAAFARMGFHETGRTRHPGFDRPTSVTMQKPLPDATGGHAGRLCAIARRDPVLWRALDSAAKLDLPDWWIVSGAIYNSVWNALTGHQPGYGIKDIDLFYFDASDLSYAAEDRVIRRALPLFETHPPVEIRNQARVHLWYEQHFGHPIAPHASSRASIAEFASQTHAVGLHLTPGGRVEICAPYGLDAVFEMRMVPNLRHPNRTTHEAKAARAKGLWPQLEIEHWPAERA
ncbi:MAG: nucleotidyltransferase family protein [Pseudomonadota bacterium]